jgi:hypothetical protein
VLHPDAGNPVVAALVVVGPVAGGPEIAVARADGLGVDGKRRWADLDGEEDGFGGLRGWRGGKEEGGSDTQSDSQGDRASSLAKLKQGGHGRAPC